MHQVYVWVVVLELVTLWVYTNALIYIVVFSSVWRDFIVSAVLGFDFILIVFMPSLIVVFIFFSIFTNRPIGPFPLEWEGFVLLFSSTRPHPKHQDNSTYIVQEMACRVNTKGASIISLVTRNIPLQWGWMSPIMCVLTNTIIWQATFPIR